MSAPDVVTEMFAAYQTALRTLESRKGEAFDRALDLLAQTNGNVIVCGMGKSGLVGAKIAATLTSTGTPSVLLHPAEAMHGDLGIVRGNDVVILISNSGETEEITRLLPALKRLSVPLIALVGTADDLRGIITDGDLRRTLLETPDLTSRTAEQVMNPAPQTISADAPYGQAEEMMLEAKIQALIVVSGDKHVDGIIQIF